MKGIVNKINCFICKPVSRWFHKEFKYIIIAIISGLIITTGITFAAQKYSENVTNELSSHLIRFHLIANSDTVEDQQMKEHIRDVVLDYMSPLLKESASMEETRFIIKAQTPQIEQLAHNVITRWGKDYCQ